MDDAANARADPINGKPIFVDSYAVFREAKRAEAMIHGDTPYGLEERIKVEYLEKLDRERLQMIGDLLQEDEYEEDLIRHHVSPTSYRVEEVNGGTYIDGMMNPVKPDSRRRSTVYKREYKKSWHRSNDVVEAAISFPLEKKFNISRLAAGYFKLKCRDADPVKNFKVLKPDGFHIAEDCIPQETLDLHNDMWAVHGISLVDFLFVYAEPTALGSVNFYSPGKYLDAKDGYTCYRIHELTSAVRKGILSFESWWHNRCDFDFTNEAENLISALRQAEKGEPVASLDG